MCIRRVIDGKAERTAGIVFLAEVVVVAFTRPKQFEQHGVGRKWCVAEILLNAIKGLADYVNEWTKSWGPDGLLKKKGMVIASEEVRTRSADIAAKMTPMDPSGLK